MNNTTLSNAIVFESLCRVLARKPNLRCIFNRADITLEMIEIIKSDILELPQKLYLYDHTVDEVTQAMLELYFDECIGEQNSNSARLITWKSITHYLKKLLLERNASSRHV